MLIMTDGELENVDQYQGKNGFGCNITISKKIDKKRDRLEFRTNSEQVAKELENLLGEDVSFVLDLKQNNFGLRIAEVVGFEKVDSKKSA